MNFYRQVRPELLGILAGILALNIWYLSCLAIDRSLVPEWYDYLIKGITVALGALVGAISAFRLNRYRETREERRKNKAALEKAIFTLARQGNALYLLLKEFDQCETEFKRTFGVPAGKSPDYTDLKHDIDRLCFLLEQKQSQLLFDLTIEQERFEQALHAAKVRRDFFIEVIHPIFKEHGLAHSRVTELEIMLHLNNDDHRDAITVTQSAYEHAAEAYDSHYAMYKRIVEVTELLFPNESHVEWTRKARLFTNSHQAPHSGHEQQPTPHPA